MGAAGRVELPFYGYEPFVLTVVLCRNIATIRLHSLQNATINATIMQSHFLQRKSASELRFLRRTSVLGRTTGIEPADAGSTVRRPSIGLHPPFISAIKFSRSVYTKKRGLFFASSLYISWYFAASRYFRLHRLNTGGRIYLFT